MSNPYITIADNLSIKSKRFKVILGGWKVMLSKQQTLNETIDGGLDICMGSINTTVQYVVRLREDETDDNYAELADLIYFYSLNNPSPLSGAANNYLTVTDHLGNVLHGYIVGNFVPDAMTTIVSGQYAWYLVPIEMRLV